MRRDQIRLGDILHTTNNDAFSTMYLVLGFVTVDPSKKGWQSIELPDTSPEWVKSLRNGGQGRTFNAIAVSTIGIPPDQEIRVPVVMHLDGPEYVDGRPIFCVIFNARSVERLDLDDLMHRTDRRNAWRLFTYKERHEKVPPLVAHKMDKFHIYGGIAAVPAINLDATDLLLPEQVELVGLSTKDGVATVVGLVSGKESKVQCRHLAMDSHGAIWKAISRRRRNSRSEAWRGRADEALREVARAHNIEVDPGEISLTADGVTMPYALLSALIESGDRAARARAEMLDLALIMSDITEDIAREMPLRAGG